MAGANFQRFFDTPTPTKLNSSHEPPFRVEDAVPLAMKVALTGRHTIGHLAADAGVDDKDAGSLKRLIHSQGRRGGGLPEWNDRRSCLAFALGNWELNYWKTYAALQSLRPDTTGTIVDVGTGSGAAAAAVLAYAADTGRAPARLLLSDSSPQQLEIAERVLSEIRNALGIHTVIETRQANLADITRDTTGENNKASMVLASHVVAGQPDVAARLVTDATERLLKPGGRMLLLERPYDEPAMKALTQVLDRAHHTSRFRHSIDLICSDSVRSRNGLSPDIYGVFAYDVSLPRDQLIAQLARDYFIRLWIGKDVGRIPDIFSKDAKYRVLADARHKSDRVWSGHDGILQYWREKVLCQIQTDVVTDRAIFEPNFAAFDFAGRFDLADSTHLISGQMVHSFAVDASGLPRITDLTERYAFEEQPRLPSEHRFEPSGRCL